MKVEDTACGEECCFVKQGFCKTDRECPFFCESTWQTEKGERIGSIKDCYPKRAMMENNNFHYRITVLQSLQEDVRNRLERIELALSHLINQSSEFLRDQKIFNRNSKEISEKEMQKQIE